MSEIQFLSDSCRGGELLPGLGAEILRSMWPGMVGTVALDGCRTCPTILDCRRAVHVEVKTTAAPANTETVFLAMLCVKCFDRGLAPRVQSGDLRTTVAEAAGLPLWAPPADSDTLPMFAGIDPAAQPTGTVRVEVEIIDGRVVMGGAR